MDVQFYKCFSNAPTLKVREIFLRDAGGIAIAGRLNMFKSKMSESQFRKIISRKE